MAEFSDDNANEDGPRSHVVDRLTRLEERHDALHGLVHEDHQILAVLKDNLQALRVNFDKLTDLLTAVIEAAKIRDADVSAIKLEHAKQEVFRGVALKVLAGGFMLFLALNSGGTFVLHLLGIAK